MRILLIIFDGLGDRPAAVLDGLTPMEAAHTPNLDRFATEGINGMLHAKSPGYPLGSPLALHLLFGYPESEFPDRGPLLARAREVEARPGEFVIAARFACAEPQDGRLMLRERFISDREQECAALAETIASHEFDGVAFRYVYCGNGDGLLFVSSAGAEVSHAVTDSDPLGVDLPLLRVQARSDAGGGGEAAAHTASALNGYLRWAHGRLRERSTAGRAPINAVITKWAGPMPSLERFEEKWGMRPASLPDEEVVSGLMLELGFDLVQIAGEQPERDLRRRLERARELLAGDHEFVHLHTKYPDPISHTGDPEGARDSIEALDRAMACYWEQLADDEQLITVVTTDHTTPSTWQGWPRGVFNDQHGGEPAPITIRGGNVRIDDVTQWGERAAVHGGLGQLRGPDFMPVLLNAAERTNMYEMRPTPTHRLYRPKPADLDALDFPS